MVTLVVFIISLRSICPSSKAERDELLAWLSDSSANSMSPLVPLIFIGDLLSAKRTRTINMARIRIVHFIYPKRFDSSPA